MQDEEEINRVEFGSRSDVLAGRGKYDTKPKRKTIEFNVMNQPQDGPLWLRVEDNQRGRGK